MQIDVQTIKVDWSQVPRGLSWLFIGQPKTGKTTQAALWSEKGVDGTLILDANMGADLAHYGANRIPITSVNPPKRQKLVGGSPVIENGEEVWEVVPPIERGYYHRVGANIGKPMEVYSLSETLKWLKLNWEELPYETVVIDTVNDVNDWLEDIVTTEMGISSLGEAAFGADWGAARKKNIDIIGKYQRFLASKAASLVLIGHSKVTQIVEGQAQLSLALPSGLARTMAGKVDVVGYTTIDKTTGKPIITFENYQERQIGSRLRPLHQATIPFSYKAMKEHLINYKEEDE